MSHFDRLDLLQTIKSQLNSKDLASKLRLKKDHHLRLNEEDSIKASLVIHSDQVLLTKTGMVIYIASMIHGSDSVDMKQTVFDEEIDEEHHL